MREEKSEDKGVTWLLRLLLILLVFLCGYIFLKLKPIWMMVVKAIAFIAVPVLISAFITYLLHPLITWLQKRDVPRSLAITSIYILFFGGLGITIVSSLPKLLSQLNELAENAPQMFRVYEEISIKWLHELYSMPEIFHDRIETVLFELEQSVDELIEKAIESIKGIVGSFFILLIIPFLVFYFLKDLEEIKMFFWHVTPEKWRKHGKLLVEQIDHSLGQYIRGQMLVIAILSLLAIFIFWLLDLPYPILLGAIIGLTEIIPYFGPFIGAVPAVLVAMTVSTKMVWIVLATVVALQIIEGSILSPLIVGKSLKMHPIVIILILLVGGELAGVVGMLLAVPVFAIGRIIVTYTQEHLVKR